MDSIFDKEYIGMSDSQVVVDCKSEQSDDYNYLPQSTNFDEHQSDDGSDEGSLEAIDIKNETLDNDDDSSQLREISVESDSTQEQIIIDENIMIDNSDRKSVDEQNSEKKKEVKSKREIEEEEREKMQ